MTNEKELQLPANPDVTILHAIITHTGKPIPTIRVSSVSGLKWGQRHDLVPYQLALVKDRGVTAVKHQALRRAGEDGITGLPKNKRDAQEAAARSGKIVCQTEGRVSNAEAQQLLALDAVWSGT